MDYQGKGVLSRGNSLCKGVMLEGAWCVQGLSVPGLQGASDRLALHPESKGKGFPCLHRDIWLFLFDDCLLELCRNFSNLCFVDMI